MIGPLHLLVIGFDEDKRARDITRIVNGLKRAKAIRLFDLLYIIKQSDGKIKAKEISELRSDEKREYGALVKRLIGVATQDVERMDAGEMAASLAVAEDEFGLSESEVLAIADRMAEGSSGILAIFEHTWARGIKEDLQKVGGYVRAQGLIDPKTLGMAADELNTIMDAISRAEASAMDELVEVKVGAEADAEEARSVAAEAIAAAQAREEEAQAAIAAAEQRETEAAQAVADAQAREEEARQQAAGATAKAQEIEDTAFDEAEVVRRAAERQQQRAMAEAAAVEQQAQEIEAKAVLRAMNALVTARIIEQKAASHALDTIIAANVLEAAAVQEAAKSLISG